MKKRLLVAILAATMSLTSFVGCNNDTTNSGKTPNGFVIGSTTELNGDFLTGWTNGSQNAAVKELIDGYSTYEFVESQEFKLNDIAVKKVETSKDSAGNKTYKFTINENLVWNNGEPITARDYVFSALFVSSKEFEQLDGADNTSCDRLLGSEKFMKGETKTFSGVRLLGDYEFSLTISKENVPYYYEKALVAVSPLPMDVIAPEVKITDDGNGATFSDNYTVELLKKTVLDPKTGYRYNPKVTCGPYNFVSFDKGSLTGVLELNDKFLGRTGDNAKGSIKKLVLKTVTPATEMDELKAGTVDLLPGVSGGEEIDSGLDIVDSLKADYTKYERSGYGKIEFACEFGPTQFKEVRQAVAYCLDRVKFATTYTGGYGSLTHGFYALSQWEYQKNKKTLERELNPYTYDVAKAEKTLIDGGWTLNSKGKEFVKGQDTIRYKKVDGKLMPLTIKWGATDNPVASLISASLPTVTEKIGMKIEQTVLDFGTLLEYIRRNSDEYKKYHMFNLAMGYNTTNPVWYYFSPEEKYLGQLNTSRINDEKLYSLANEMKTTEPGNKEAWSKKWVELQKRYNELLPTLPLYSDIYHEFFNTKLKNYKPNGLWGWQYAILRANLEA